MRVNLKELIEELEAIVLTGDYHYYPIQPAIGKSTTVFKRKIEVPLGTIEQVIHELKQLENIYNQ